MNKKEKEHKGASQHRSFSYARPEGTKDNYMVRLFTALCKSLIEIISDEDAFYDITSKFNHYDKPCPRCGAVGKLIPHGKYTRGFTYLIADRIIDTKLIPLRFKCESCNVTHALLPNIVIPYGRYSLKFVLTVLIAYFERTITVVDICAQFGIAVSTLYEWKKRVQLHKELMLGLLISKKTSALTFLQGLLKKKKLSESLSSFYHNYGFSFMQNASLQTSQSHPP